MLGEELRDGVLGDEAGAAGYEDEWFGIWSGHFFGLGGMVKGDLFFVLVLWLSCVDGWGCTGIACRVL